MSVGQMCVDQMSVDQMCVDQMSVNQMSVDHMSVDQKGLKTDFHLVKDFVVLEWPSLLWPTNNFSQS